MRILIIGGGIIGLSIGWQLTRKGCDVHLYDAHKIGQQASWAAAGLLCPTSETCAEDEELLKLCEYSLALYPQFLKEISEDAHCELGFESQGTLFVGLDRDDRNELEHRFSRKHNCQWISGKEAREREPLLSPRVSCGVWIVNEMQIDNRKLLQALLTAFLNRKGIVHEQCKISSIWKEEGLLRGICTDEQIPGDCVIHATGAWTEGIRPQKGQILTLQMQKGFQLSKIVRTPRVYLAPKRDGLLRLGATSEEMGFDRVLTAGAQRELLQAAYEVVPAVEQMEFKEAIAQLRPMSHHRLPIIEEMALNGSFRATGHGRSGYLLAPYTAITMSKLICKSK